MVRKGLTKKVPIKQKPAGRERGRHVDFGRGECFWWRKQHMLRPWGKNMFGAVKKQPGGQCGQSRVKAGELGR